MRVKIYPARASLLNVNRFVTRRRLPYERHAGSLLNRMERSGEKSRSRAKYVGRMSAARVRTSDKKTSGDEVYLADNEQPRLHDALSVRDREIGPRITRCVRCTLLAAITLAGKCIRDVNE